MNTQWKLVPVEPTREMLVAALKTNGACPTYAAMLSAAPTPPAAFAPPVAWLDPDSIQHGEILSAQAKKNSEFLGQQARARRFSVPLYAHPDAGEIARLTAERDALQQRLNAADQRIDELERDKARLDALESNCWDIRFGSSPNGDAGDSSINIEIVGHWMDQPVERVIGENYSENLRAAIDQAMAAPAYPPARPEYPEPEPDADADWHMNPCKQGHRDVGASGGIAACNQCNEKIEAATTQEAFDQWNASHPPASEKPGQRFTEQFIEDRLGKMPNLSQGN